MNEQAKMVLLYIHAGMRVLSARVVLLLAMLLTFGLFAWAMYLPGWERITAATIFAVLIFLPATRIDAAQSRDRAAINTTGSE
jgi:hypothetical protein